jgi:hypothetical protein
VALEFLYNLELVRNRLVRDRAISCALEETFDEPRGKAEEERDVRLGRKASGAAYGFETTLVVP